MRHWRFFNLALFFCPCHALPLFLHIAEAWMKEKSLGNRSPVPQRGFLAELFALDGVKGSQRDCLQRCVIEIDLTMACWRITGLMLP